MTGPGWISVDSRLELSVRSFKLAFHGRPVLKTVAVHELRRS